jgi:hypothetical protein
MEADRQEEPHTRLTRLCEAAVEAMETSPEYQEDDKLIIFIDDEQEGGLVLHGYDDDTDAMGAIMSHMKALFQVNGLRLVLLPMPEGEDE